MPIHLSENDINQKRNCFLQILVLRVRVKEQSAISLIRTLEDKDTLYVPLNSSSSI